MPTPDCIFEETETAEPRSPFGLFLSGCGAAATPPSCACGPSSNCLASTGAATVASAATPATICGSAAIGAPCCGGASGAGTAAGGGACADTEASSVSPLLANCADGGAETSPPLPPAVAGTGALVALSCSAGTLPMEQQPTRGFVANFKPLAANTRGTAHRALIAMPQDSLASGWPP